MPAFRVGSISRSPVLATYRPRPWAVEGSLLVFDSRWFTKAVTQEDPQFVLVPDNQRTAIGPKDRKRPIKDEAVEIFNRIHTDHVDCRRCQSAQPITNEVL